MLFFIFLRWSRSLLPPSLQAGGGGETPDPHRFGHSEDRKQQLTSCSSYTATAWLQCDSFTPSPVTSWPPSDCCSCFHCPFSNKLCFKRPLPFTAKAPEDLAVWAKRKLVTGSLKPSEKFAMFLKLFPGVARQSSWRFCLYDCRTACLSSTCSAAPGETAVRTADLEAEQLLEEAARQQLGNREAVFRVFRASGIWIYLPLVLKVFLIKL